MQPRNPADGLSSIALKSTLVAVAVVLAATTGPATGATLSGLTVTDADRTLGPGESVRGVSLATDVEYDYESTHPADEVTIVLYAATPDGDYTEIDSKTLSDPGANGSGTAHLSGDLTTAGVFPDGTFALDGGQQVSKTVDVKAVMTVYRDGERIGVADAATTAEVHATKEDMTVTASVSGSGSLSVLTTTA